MFTRIPSIALPPVEEIKDLRQVLQSEINRIVDAINAMTVDANFDVRNHRIINVAWPVNAHDAVNLEYLKKFLERRKRPVEQVGSIFYDKCTFGLGIDSVVQVRNNVCPPYIVMAKKMTLVCVRAIAKRPPTGQNLIFRIKRNGTSIRSANFELLDNNPDVHIWNAEDIDDRTFVLDDIITIDILQTGSGYPGGSIVVVLKFYVNDSSPL